ncbi:hypothetical protein MCUN1_003263 [Malassezia cuniculi]|uniref:chitin deacetylase n=1 Tax=Malassezia cuniculi TaxID=948313 RepID=A0AAF0EWD4_9BASI|nr:hypothetical protein MCUN1_003263 [Malassezia cuniculi]
MFAPVLIGLVPAALATVVVKRQDTQNAASFAKIVDPKKECKWYSEPTLSKIMDKQFPSTEGIASIVDGDEDAKKIWQEIQDSGIIPGHVKVKDGSSNNYSVDSSALHDYNTKSDPDCWWTASKCTTPKTNADKIGSDLERCEEPSTWGLTFDDGPHCAHNEFYNFLQEHKLRASMFFIGSNVVSYPLQAQRALVDGHDLCVHSWSHHSMTTLSNEQVFAELYYTAKAIKVVTGATPQCWRPPFGDTDDRVRAIAAGLGMRNVLWDKDTDDWKMDEGTGQSEIESNYRKIISRANSTSPIVLAHEVSTHTMNMFMTMYPEIEKAFQHIVPVTACVNATKPGPEDITYPNFAQYVSGDIGAKGQPDGENIKVNADAKYQPTPLAQQTQKGSFMNPNVDATSSSANSTSSGSSDSASSGNSTSTDANSSNDKSSETDSTVKSAAMRVSVSLMALFIPLFVAML